VTKRAAAAEPVVEDSDVAVEDVGTDTEQEQRSRTRPKRQPPYAVIVENDDFHTFVYVIEVLRRVCGHSRQRALFLTTQIHVTGRAVVWSGALEVAELKRDQIRGFGTDYFAEQPVKFPLGVTIEPLPGD